MELREQQRLIAIAIVLGAVPVVLASALAALMFSSARHHWGGMDAIGLAMLCLAAYALAVVVIVPALAVLVLPPVPVALLPLIRSRYQPSRRLSRASTRSRLTPTSAEVIASSES